MGGLLGPAGGLKELRCATSLSIAPTADTVLQVAQGLDFETEWVQLRAGRPARQWAVEVGTAEPDALDHLVELEEWQRLDRALLVYYSEAAQLDNLLDPEASMMRPSRWMGVQRGGSSIEPDATGPVFMHSASGPADGGWVHLLDVPVPYWRTVTVTMLLSAYEGQAARLVVTEVGIDGADGPSREVSTSGARERVATTFRTSGETVSLRFAVSGAVTIARPQVTLTDGPRDWVPGQGCRHAVLVAPAGEDVQLAIPDTSSGRRSSYQWAIREVRRPN
ncbi:hypothetical protein ACF1CM_07135 [Micrococcus luteus]